MNKIYAGIGSRETPTKMLCLMKIIGMVLATEKYILHSGAAKGADQAFTEGAVSIGGKVNLFLPWSTYEQQWINNLRKLYKSKIHTTIFNKNKDKEAINSVYKFHPCADRLKNSVMALHARNYSIIKNTKFIICYTKDGRTSGGTGQAIRIAESSNKTIYNLGNEETIQKLLNLIKTNTLG